MKFGRISALAAAFFAVPIWAATLTVPNNIDIEVLDGQKYRSEASFLGGSNTKIDLNDGDHQLVVRLSGNLKTSGDAELYKTGYFVVTLNSEGNSELKLATKSIRNKKDLNAFNKKPEFFLTNNQGQPYPFKMALLEKEGMQIGRDLVRELSEFNATGNPAALESRAPFAALAMNNPQTALSNGSNSVSEILLSEQMLHYWFQQADKPTRERFLSWAARVMKKQ
ncbi:DUF2057 domain-containing protein [Sansalvadorimonas sp. 2012CJ34-2]|uniref:UPF0319 protein M3P05_00455 n=1 Tax=Parendozoicomonas callyspongiae TaxID=2942213 RepID=A0ABT0PAR8_9GAMM|nr:DUF2057 domain-containing protein [Sansalvadorimonas sp. 2012CJ34-2]MCL6268420.1 DUF2057 domain-containing protein [Sansalvadorimonas sp. 2012CJ34-2]